MGIETGAAGARLLKIDRCGDCSHYVDDDIGYRCGHPDAANAHTRSYSDPPDWCPLPKADAQSEVARLRDALEQTKAAIGDRLLGRGPLSKEYAASVIQTIDSALAGTLDTRADWLPIEQAPKDRSRVRVGWPGVVGGDGRYDGRLGKWFSSETGKIYEPDQPTHWMPLPEPPSEPKEQA